jgi:hypothetical protein
MTDAGVSGEGTQSAKALPPNNPAINNAISQRLVINLPELACQGGVQGERPTEDLEAGSAPNPAPQAELETGRIMRTRIPKLIAEINTIIADHSNSDSEEEQEAIELLKRARHKLGLARVKLQEADLKKHRLAAGQ